MKNKIFLNTFRTIKRMFPRFLVLLLISFLGALTFSGLESTSSSMNKSLDRYMDNYNSYDIKIISTLGLTDKDIKEINKIEGIEKVEGSYSKDVLFSINNEEYVLNISSITEKINDLELKNGKMPSNANEIVVEENLLKLQGLTLGDIIEVSDSQLEYNELKIVGTVSSSLYLNATTYFQNRGNSTIGTGQVDYYSFALPSLYKIDYYSSIYITIDDIKKEITSEEKYIEKVDIIKEKIDKIKEERIKDRINVLKQQLEITKGFYELFIANYQKNINQNKDEYNSILENFEIEDNNIEGSINELTNQINELEETLNNITIDNPNYDQYLLELEETKELLKQYNKLLELKNEIQKEEKMLIEYKKTGEKSINDMERMLGNNDSKWFVMDRSGYYAYSNYVEYSRSIANIAKVFSVILLALSVLICLVSMNRMIEDDRQEIGTLKSLGFSNSQIRTKYLLFGLFATLIGGLIGALLGPILISPFIFNIFELLFELPKFYIILDIKSVLISVLSIMFLVVGMIYLTLNKVIIEKPAQLIRPKAPKKGTRVVLERIKFIWRKLNFTNKVTIRNLFRYKKRALVTILGVAGCTAIIMSGFGLRDAFSGIPDRQIGEIFKFDALVYVNNYEIEENEIFSNDKILSKTVANNININVDGIDTRLIVFEDDSNIDNFISFYDYKTSEKRVIEDNKIIITQKLAQLKNIQVGDYLEFVDASNYNYKFEVSAITEHYFEHYIYINKATFEASGGIYTPNLVILNTCELNDQEKAEFKKELLNNDKIFNVSYLHEILDSIDTMINLLNKVILIVIILASILSFVVLYNLANINIYERKREIASLKVLGFYNYEIDMYIGKESFILTFIGILIGYIIGNPITLLIIRLIEIDKLFFVKDIYFSTYLYSGLLTLLFALIINYVSHFILKKINMIDSLKSVE